MSLRSTIRPLAAVAVGLAVVVAPTSAHAGVTLPPATGALNPIFYTPGHGTVPAGAPVHVLLGTPAGVDRVEVFYRPGTGGDGDWVSAGTVPALTSPDLNASTARIWDGNVTIASDAGAYDLEAVAYSSTNAVVGETFADDAVTVAASATPFDFTLSYNNTNGNAGNNVAHKRIGIYRRADGHSWAALGVTTTPAGTPTTLTDPSWVAPPSAIPAPAGAVKDGVTYAPVDLAPVATAPGTAVVRGSATLGGAPVSDATPIGIYAQHPTRIRVQKTTVSGTSRAFTATVRDEYNLPITGVVVRIAGQATGAGNPRVFQTAVTDVNGQAAFTGPYGDGGYLIWADVDLNNGQNGSEPEYQVTPIGRASYVAPGHSLYHNDKRMKKAGGVVNDSYRGSKDAWARRYQWIDQDGQLSYRNLASKRKGAAKITGANEVMWVNAHGAPFNPSWLGKKGRFETKAWTAISKRPGLRNAATTFAQDAHFGLSVEWEVKNIKPFKSTAALNAAFANLAANARAAYGGAWQSRVQIKMLSNVAGRGFAFNVLKAAKLAGFTTIYLARGVDASNQTIPVAAQQYIDYVRGAVNNIYPAGAIPGQDGALTPGLAPAWIA